MVDRTDIHFRNFLRYINKNITLYTEMITAPALINGDVNKLLKKNPIENPIVLQIATSNIDETIKVAKLIKNFDYDEINLNIGCPSDRVSNYNMGAYLMSKPYLVKEFVRILKEETNKKITIKNRIGIDGRGILENNRIIDKYEELLEFVDITSAEKYIIHARIAILKGLSPKENRTIPPLDYERVYKLKNDRKNLKIEINGGIKNIEDVNKHLEKVDSVMIGRAFYDNPILANNMNEFMGNEKKSYLDILKYIFHYTEQLEKNGENTHHFLRHTLGLFYDTKYSKLWKNVVSPTKASSKDIDDFIKKYIVNPV